MAPVHRLTLVAGVLAEYVLGAGLGILVGICGGDTICLQGVQWKQASVILKDICGGDKMYPQGVQGGRP